MKKIFLASLFSISTTFAFGQAPMKPDATRGTDDTLISNSTYVDTLGAGKQVPNDPSFTSGARQIPTDSSRDGYAKGGKSKHDYSHTKQHAAKKDTTHVRYSSSKKVTRSTNRQSANAKKNK